MVPSSAITITADDECLTCCGFSLGETVRLGNFKIIADYFSGLSPSPKRADAGAAFMGSTNSGAPTPWWSTIEDSTKEFLMASSGEGSFGLPSHRRRGTGALLTPVTSTPRMKKAPTTQATMTVPPWTVARRPETKLPFERRYAHHGGQQCKPVLGSPSLSNVQCHSEASSLASKMLL
jgi:hypothetical protein